MSFKLNKKLDNGVRVGSVETPHGSIETPFFMPVGTVGSVKATAPWELNELSADIVLSNTYHLYLRPGEQLIKSLGGLHKFMGWDKPILTDSGGYQVFSLARGGNHNKLVISNEAERSSDSQKISPTRISPEGRNDTFMGVVDKQNLVKITEDGVEFKSHLDGSKHFFTPEKVIQIQLDLGVDILMPLDVCPSGKATREEVERSVELTIKWAKRSKEYFDEQMIKYHPYTPPKLGGEREGITRPLLHGIVQGGLYPDLREKSARELIALDFDGHSVGGLAVDLETRQMWEIVKMMGEILPSDKQRYLMGVGTPDDIIKAAALGMDMFDCVLPTRLARHGNVYVCSQQSAVSSSKDSKLQTTNYQLVNLLNSQYRTDGGVIDENCGCHACSGGLSKAYISHLLRSNEILGLRLTTLHNLWQYLDLMKDLKNGK